MSKNILITGARAPASLELARHLSKENKVFVSDSLYFSLARFSRASERFIFTRKPSLDFEGFKQDLIEAVSKYEIDLIIPTCEEAFYLSKCKTELEKRCNVFVDGIDKMQKIHSKVGFLELINKRYAKVPDTRVIDKIDICAELLKGRLVKIEYSRFGNGVFSGYSSLEKLVDISEANRYLSQEKVEGVEYSTYTIANNGHVLGTSVYHCDYRIKGSSGVYFRPVVHQKINDFIRAFVQGNKFTGQIGFDVIDNGTDIFIIDANPRATSGIHLLEGDLNLTEKQLHMVQSKKSKGLILAVLLLADKSNVSIKEMVKSLASYREAVFRFSDPLPSICQLLTLGELLYRKFRYKVNVTEAATFDIEWDGDK
tara:strand:+ start:54 stop:1160 length:1107 start_codon:yes stop_codon:yes gene_type:complete